MEERLNQLVLVYAGPLSKIRSYKNNFLQANPESKKYRERLNDRDRERPYFESWRNLKERKIERQGTGHGKRKREGDMETGEEALL